MTRIGDFDANNVSFGQVLAYATALEQHIMYVQDACSYLAVDSSQWLVHDDSKYSRAEFEGYVLQHGKHNGEPKHPRFVLAWLHHVHTNPHHWQHWVFPDRWAPPGTDIVDGAMPMPPEYVGEMIGDWLGASRAYTGKWDMTAWLDSNLPNMNLHPTTRRLIDAWVRTIDYEEMTYRFT